MLCIFFLPITCCVYCFLINLIKISKKLFSRGRGEGGSSGQHGCELIQPVRPICLFQELCYSIEYKVAPAICEGAIFHQLSLDI